MKIGARTSLSGLSSGKDARCAGRATAYGGNAMSQYKIAVIPGDGIGKEVVPEGIRVLEAAGAKFGVSFRWDEFPWSCDYYLKTGRMMPEDGLAQIRNHDAIFLGAVGFPGVPDHISLWGLLIPIRRGFQQYANVRPVRLMPGIQSPLRGREPGDIDFIVVRENTEGEYSTIGGRIFEETEQELVVQESIFTRRGVDRILRYAFELARSRPKKQLTWATKSNGVFISMPYWDERARAMAAHYPDVRVDQYHIDILTAHFVRNPDWFDVVVASNLFGDILSDLGPACTGTIAIAPSANLNPEREFPSMFEPVHGSAPDIYGQNIANPIGQIWSGAMMLAHLGHPEAADAVVRAIEVVLRDGPHTRDIGGKASTQEMGEAIAAAV
jgi:tartrate dehydrogenase/decarboxylase / D-malate dehydrogenase